MKVTKETISKQDKCAVVGLGYVGLPLALGFGKVISTIGFDLNNRRITNLKNGIDSNDETPKEDFKQATHIEFTNKAEKLKEANFIIVAVPTPITKNKQPDLYCLKSASEIVGKNLQKGAIVVFESTVYPGVTEDICVPIIEKNSKLVYKKDFKVGYSPERINPGDKKHTLENIIKVVSGCDEESLERIAKMYSLVVKAGVYKAESIKVAEAAKVIENTQRDLNIALMNELAIIFNKMKIDTSSVLKAAGTKWNFINMKPGLVGGHCIGVDPYYLTYKAEELGHHPQVILAGRKINDDMGKYIAENTIKALIEAGKPVKGSKVLIMGITFKENVSDIRNSRVVDIINELKEYGLDTVVCDPLANKEEVKKEYGFDLVDYDKNFKVSAVVIAVKHDYFINKLTIDSLKNHFSINGAKGVVVDAKGMFERKDFSNKDIVYWKL
ncbi:MAG: nucleotide sugar dehydrogenase [Candidatus Omnitrophica bacterium]|jgi:UDP-N-acetyl-D-galactosamine dehydrogenase|nr:nucleotide sugar dehydrogenase [Candidatus Omnitrophota bacterium]